MVSSSRQEDLAATVILSWTSCVMSWDLLLVCQWWGINKAVFPLEFYIFSALIIELIRIFLSCSRRPILLIDLTFVNKISTNLQILRNPSFYRIMEAQTSVLNDCPMTAALQSCFLCLWVVFLKHVEKVKFLSKIVGTLHLKMLTYIFFCVCINIILIICTVVF